MSEQLSVEEAEEFLEMYERIEKDMSEAFDDCATEVFGDGSVDVEEKWGVDAGELYTICSRDKVKVFAEKVYM